MKRIIKLTESDLVRIVKKIISEQTNTDDVEEAFNDALDKIKEGGDFDYEIDFNNIQDVVTQFVVQFVLELTTKRNQDYVRYTRGDEEWLSDEEFDEAFEKVMSDFKERIVSVYPEIKAHVDDANERERTDYKTRRRMFNKPNYTELQGDDEDEDEEGIRIEDDEIIQMIMNSESEIDQEDYDDVYDWMLVIFSDVESQLTDMGVDDDIVDDIRMKYDDVLMSIWRGGNDN